MVSVGAPEVSMTPAAPTEESGAYHAPRFGFGISDEEARVAGIPAERRPLSLRDIRTWTVGSLVGAVLFAAVVAIALSGGDAHGSGTERAQMRPDVVPALAAAAPPATTPRGAVPLEALPIAKDEPLKTSLVVPKKTTHKAVTPAHVSLTERSSTTTAAKPSSRAFVPNRAESTTAKTKASAKSTTAKKTSAP
jgi:hypothetical protein